MYENELILERAALISHASPNSPTRRGRYGAISLCLSACILYSLSTMNIHLQNISHYLVHLIYMLMKHRTPTDYHVSTHELHPYKRIESKTVPPDMNNLSAIISYRETYWHTMEYQSFTDHSAQGGAATSYRLLCKRA